MTNPTSRKGYEFSPLTYAVIGACQDVQRQLGLHCMEVDYQRALAIALSKRGISALREVEIPLTYEGVVITKRRVDFLVEAPDEEFILETKAASALKPDDIEQCLLYLHKGGYKLCLLINFGEKPLKVRRFVHTPVNGAAEG
jgi:GxxExxY protein